jgi:hypothetical protein
LAAATASAAWSPGERVSDSSTRAFLGQTGSKAAAVDRDGNVHVVWNEVEEYVFPSGFRRMVSEVFHAVRTPGGWSVKTKLTESDGWNSLYPSCAADSQGNVYVVWDDYKYTTNTMLPKPEVMMSVCAGAVCDAPRLISATSPGSFSSWLASIAVDGNDQVTVVWQDRRVDPTYRVFRGNQNGEVGIVAVGEAPSVAAAGASVLCAWQAGPGIVAQDLVSGQPTTLATSGAAASVAVSQDGIGYVLWNGGAAGVRYSRFESGVWSAAAAAWAGSFSPSVIADRCGQAHAVYADSAKNLYYAVLDGSAWSTAPALWAGAGSPNIAIDTRSAAPGGLHLVWNHSLATPPDSDIFYASMPGCDENAVPVAEAGPDQSIVLIGTEVRLDGRQSYDEDGDPLAYSWSMVERPAGSNAEISDPGSPAPVFTADVHGNYVIQLVVSDGKAASAPDTLTVSFENVRPVASAGNNLTILQGGTAYLDGSGSSDANADPLSFAWSLQSVPEGSLASLATPAGPQTAFVADLPGTYVVSLVANDGFVDSLPTTVTVLAVTSVDAVTAKLMELIAAINALPDAAFKNSNMRNALTNKIGAALQMIEAGAYQGALDKLVNDLLPKMDGCEVAGVPDATDWIRDCDSQASAYPPALSAAEILQGM